jgi:hypothetical protein
MESMLYEEHVPTALFIKATIVMLLSLVGFLLLFLAFYLQPWDNEAIVGLAVSISTLAFVSIFALNFRGIKIQLTSKTLSVRYGLLNLKSIRLAEISACKPAKASFKRFGGVGIRYGIDGSWAYSTSFGNAVEIVPKHGRTFVFSSNNPKDICQIVNSRLQK